ncbi:DUF6089 family protein [Cytophagaceae bacterium ABcell3]|nr:DUF6089 family protein [Cytophagaceae bacterium ABcell3]
MKKIGKFILPIFFALIAFSANGQKNEIGISLGALNYTGEYAPRFDVLNYRPGGMVFYRRNFSPVFTLRGSIMTGRIKGSDEGAQDPVPAARDGEFHNNITEAAIMAEYNFLDFRRYKDRRRFAPYLTAGLAIFNYQRAYPGTAIRGGAVNPSIPIGIGIKYKLTKTVNLNAEFVARKTFTDYLDNISDTYADGYSKQLANPHLNDWYYYTGFSISYTFYGIACPEFQRKNNVY